MNRRAFLAAGAAATYGGSTGRVGPRWAWGAKPAAGAGLPFKLSLAQWSLHRRFFGRKGPKLDNLEFAKIARGFGIEAVEYVNQFFKDKARDTAYLGEMKKRAADQGVKSLLIMCDGEGHLGDPDTTKRRRAVENHLEWLEAAKFLGCHSIRVNAHAEGTYEEQMKLAADGLRQLSEQATRFKLDVIVENHGGLSSNGAWLAGVMKTVNLPNCGTLPDFGNFPREINRYDAVEMLMPFAKAVSAKSHDFDEAGNETHTSYERMMRIVRDAGYHGYVGVEYEGGKLGEHEGIIATKRLLERVGKQQARVKPILNGRNLDGWVKIGGGDWSIDKGVLVGRNGRNWKPDPEVSGSWLRSEKPYGDFRLELQYAISRGGNSGVFFRSAAEKNPGYTGYEMQITDSHGSEPSKKGSAGAVNDLVAPSKDTARPAGAWNTVTILARGTRLVVELNGEKVVDTKQTRSARGHVGLQNYGAESVIKFRNVRIEPL